MNLNFSNLVPNQQESFKYTPTLIKQVIEKGHFTPLGQQTDEYFKYQHFMNSLVEQTSFKDFYTPEQFWMAFENQDLPKGFQASWVLKDSVFCKDKLKRAFCWPESLKNFLLGNCDKILKINVQSGFVGDLSLLMPLIGSGQGFILELEPGAKLSLKLEYAQFGKELFGSSLWVNLAPDSELNFLETVRGDVFSARGLWVDLEQGARFFHEIKAQGPKYFRNQLGVMLLGQNAQAHLKGAFDQQATSFCENETWIGHQVPRAYSNQEYRALLKDEAQFVFKGHVKIEPDAVESQTHQLAKALFLSPHVTANLKPYLDIECDDVIATHGAAISQLQEQELFYLQSRGLNEQKAKALLESAFLEF